MLFFNQVLKAAIAFFREDKPGTLPSPTLPLPSETTETDETYHFSGNVPHPHHVACMVTLMEANNRSFNAYLKIVRPLLVDGASGAHLYQTAYQTLTTGTPVDVPGLVASAEALEIVLLNDEARVQALHERKVEDAFFFANKAPDELISDQLHAKLAVMIRELASYKMANAQALAELQVHHQAVKRYLGGTP